MHEKIDFFLGVLSPTGYGGYFKQVTLNQENNVVLLKGTPGCGKSTLIKKMSDYFVSNGHMVECIHCALNPNSLDAIVCDDNKFALLDATAPHLIEPKYPVAFEQIMPLYYCLNVKKISKNRKEIIAKYQDKALLTDRVVRYMAAAGSLLCDTQRTSATFCDFTKAANFAQIISRKYLPVKKSDLPLNGEEKTRFLSAITQDGIIFYKDTITKLANNIIILHDNYGSISKHILFQLRKEALSKGYKIITCYCSMSPFDKIEHIIIPELNFAIITNNAYHSLSVEKTKNIKIRNIHCERFCNKQSMLLRKKRIQFNKKATKELLNQAQELLIKAGKCHEEIEKYYIEAADFTALERAYKKIIDDLPNDVK